MSYTSIGWTSRVPSLVDVLTLESTSNPHVASPDFLSFLSVVQALKIEFLPITWDAARQDIGSGATAKVRESLVNLHTSFAFKRFWEAEDDSFATHHGSEEDVFRLLTNEIQVLAHKTVREHPNIVQLQGVCWDIDPDGRPWPVLALEKSQFGDLFHFAKIPVGRDLDFDDRLGICTDIGVALMDMHAINIIHGDIKPQNVLIFKDDDGGYAARMTDFGYSTPYLSPGQRLKLPRSLPWNAPENDRSAREWTMTAAKKTDVYSFGLLCFWLLFETYLSGTRPLPVALRASAWSQHFASASSMSTDAPDMETLMNLKASNGLIDCARDLLVTQGLAQSQRTAIEDVLTVCLSSDPEMRDTNFRDIGKKIFPQVLGSGQDVVTLMDVESLKPAGVFEVQDHVYHLYACDYRVRRYIGSHVISKCSVDPNTCGQAAFCYYFGFGVPRDEAKALEILKYSAQGSDMIRVAKSRYREGSTIIRPSSLQTLADQHHVHNEDLSYHYLKGSILKEVEDFLLRELDDLVVVFGDEPVSVVSTVRGQLRHIYNAQGRWRSAADVQEEVVKAFRLTLGDDHPETMSALGNLATAMGNSGRIEEAALLDEQVASMATRKYGEDHTITHITKGGLATTYLRQGKSQLAEKLFAETLESSMQTMGEEHHLTLNLMANLASAIWEQDRFEEAIELETRVLETRKRVLGEDHPDTLWGMANLALSLFSLDRKEAAISMQIEVTRLMRRTMGGEHPNSLTAMANTAKMLESTDATDLAESLETRVLESRRKVLGDEHPDTLTSIGDVAGTKEAKGEVDEAITLLDECLRGRRKILGPEHADTLETERAMQVWRRHYKK